MDIDEIKVDLIDLIKRCIEKWKFVLICMIIGGILFNGLGYIKSVKNAKAVEAQIKAQTEESNEEEKMLEIGEYMQKLSEREKAEVESAVSSYREYQQEYVDGLAYYQNSVKMQLNPECVPTVRLQYMVDNHYEVVYPTIEKKDTTKDIVNSFAGRIMSDDVNEAVAAALGMEENAAYTRELIDAKYTENSLLTITIVAENENDCDAIAEIVKSKINAEMASVRSVFGDFDLTLASETYFENADKDLITVQQQMMTSLNGLKTAISNLINGMTDDQKSYYYALLDNEEIITSGKDETDTTDAFVMPEMTVPEITYVNVKYIVIGFFLGIVVACGWMMFKYIVSGNLRMVRDVQEVFGIAVLGCITTKKHKVFKKPYDAFSEEEQVEMIVSGMQIVAEKEHMKSFYVTGTATSTCCMEVCKKIQEAAMNRGITCKDGKSVIYDPKSAEEMAKTDGVVLVEQIDVSNYEEIAREKELSKKYHVPVVGCVVIE